MNRCLSTLARWTALLLASASCALAHSVWLEPGPDGKLVARFGELDGDVEKSPGRLDDLEAPLAVKLPAGADSKPFAITKKEDHFALAGAESSQPAAVEIGYPVMAQPGQPGRRPIFYSRWQPAGGAAAEPALTLDIVPTGKTGEARVYFRGKPLPNAKAKLYAPNGSHTPLTADAEGLLKFTAPDPGRWVITIGRHGEDLAGFAAGKSFAVLSHNASLAWEQPKS